MAKPTGETSATRLITELVTKLGFKDERGYIDVKDKRVRARGLRGLKLLPNPGYPF